MRRKEPLLLWDYYIEYSENFESIHFRNYFPHISGLNYNAPCRPSGQWLVKDQQLLEKPQRQSTKLVVGLQPLPYGQPLVRHKLFSMTYWRALGHMMLAYHILTSKNHCSQSLTVYNNSTQLLGHSLLCEELFTMEVIARRCSHSTISFYV